MTKLIEAPCKNCDQRKLGCHDRCEKYQEYNKYREEVRKYLRNGGMTK